MMSNQIERKILPENRVDVVEYDMRLPKVNTAVDSEIETRVQGHVRNVQRLTQTPPQAFPTQHA